MTIAPVRPATGVPPVAWRPLLAVGGALAVLLIAVSDRYGYHRDELYFLQAGQHLAWGYPDQPPLTPALARLVSAVAPDSLIALRVPSALLAAGVVVLTGLIAREFNGARAEQLLSACCLAVSAALLLIGHLFGTTMIDLFCWVAVCWLAARLLRGGDPRWWLALGAVLGIGVLNKSLLAVLPVALLVGVVIAGPRSVLRNRWFVIAVILAALLVAPNLWWQNANGWPQLTLSQAIAAGESGSSQPRWLFLPYQLVLISPILVPIWVIGLGRLFTAPALVRFRCFGWAYVLLFLVFLAAAGKPYYLVGLYPVLLAAGAPVVVAWLRRRAPAARRMIVIAALGLSLIINATLMLPLLPVQAMAGSPIADVNYDGGETAGWPEFVATVDSVVDSLPADDRDSMVLLTGNYGEAGAIDRFGPAAGLPAAYSGHNAYHLWGPPPDRPDADVVVAVGLSRQFLAQHFGSVTEAARIDNTVGLDNDEQGRPVWVCRGQRTPWSQWWPQLARLG